MNPPLSSYFKVSPIPGTAQISERLWRGSTGDDRGDEATNQAVAFEQYKLYVEMADRVSSRRLTANSFFLSLNTAIFALVGALWDNDIADQDWVLVFPAIVLVAQCLTWFWMIRSYRQLNAAKWAVVGAFEERLPTAPYSDAEWEAVGRGEDPARYWPMTRVETWVPLLFAVTYVGAFIAALVV